MACLTKVAKPMGEKLQCHSVVVTLIVDWQLNFNFVLIIIIVGPFHVSKSK